TSNLVNSAFVVEPPSTAPWRRSEVSDFASQATTAGCEASIRSPATASASGPVHARVAVERATPRRRASSARVIHSEPAVFGCFRALGIHSPGFQASCKLPQHWKKPDCQRGGRG